MSFIKIVEKKWGREEWIANNDLYCGKRLVVKHGFCCSMHHHKKKHETFFVAQGRVLLETMHDPIGEVRGFVLGQGELFTVPPDLWHRFTGLDSFGPVIFEFSTHHEDSDSYRAAGMSSGKASEEVMNEYS